MDTPLLFRQLSIITIKWPPITKNGAKTDPLDVSGQSALHWAIDNDNQELIELLIQHKRADPNLYTDDGQPPLFKPILRKNRLLRDFLIKAGADINFANDYINAKLIGHRFELKGLYRCIYNKWAFY